MRVFHNCLKHPELPPQQLLRDMINPRLWKGAGGPARKQVDGTTWFLPAWVSVTQWFQTNPRESFQSNDSFHLPWLCLEQAHIIKKESRYLSQCCHIANILFLQQQILSAKLKCCECGLVETNFISVRPNHRLKKSNISWNQVWGPSSETS